MPSDLKLSVQSVTPDVTLTLSDPYIGSAYSPQVDVTEIEGGHEVTITHKAPSGIVTDTFDVLDGVDGTDGVDGVSPTVEIESTTDAHTITITDADGAHSYTVDTYADEESARATAESSRVAAETARVTAEQARASAESSRAAAESARVTAEASRATAEQTRAAADSSRDEAEQARATAENARATAESARATAEQGRATAEQARAAAETARASAESGRVTAEQERASAENARASAESARVSAESARASAETSRTTAESARATAESTRATEWATIKTEAQDTISAAEDATDAAESAASDATAAAAEARAASAATWLSGNVLFGELSEGSVLTADDAYAAPPKGVSVYGKSTQVQTTGKNLLSDVEGDWQKLAIPNVATRWVWFIPVEESASYTYSRNTSGSAGFFLGWCDDTSFTNYEVIVTLTNYQQYTVTNTTHAYLVVSIASSSTTAQIADTIKTRECQIEQASTKTVYEPWSGKAASPRPDWVQSIKIVDNLALWLTGKNLLNINAPRKTSPYTITGSGFHFSFAASNTHGNENTYTISGNTISYNSVPRYLGFGIEVSVVPNTTYALSIGSVTISDTSSTWYARIAYYDASGEYLYWITASTNSLTGTFTTPSNAAYAIICICANTADVTVTVTNIQLELGTTATSYEPYVGTSVSIPLSNHYARSLPDGTRDTLTLSYVAPSTEHEGWGVFSETLVQRLDTVDLGTRNWQAHATKEHVFYASMAGTGGQGVPSSTDMANVLCTALRAERYANVMDGSTDNIINYASTTNFLYAYSSAYTTAADFKTAMTGVTLQFMLATPVTHDLGEIELPILPNPLTAWADGGSAQPTLQLEYERSLSIVIPRIEAAISDLATS